jgi:hypothetical protein
MTWGYYMHCFLPPRFSCATTSIPFSGHQAVLVGDLAIYCVDHSMTDQTNSPPPTPTEQITCRICLDGPDDDLGRLIRPCLCKGSISVRHHSRQ